MDLATAQTHLAAWEAADLAVASGQEYTIGTANGQRSLTRVDAKDIADRITYWQRTVNQLQQAASGFNNNGHAVASWNS